MIFVQNKNICTEQKYLIFDICTKQKKNFEEKTTSDQLGLMVGVLLRSTLLRPLSLQPDNIGRDHVDDDDQEPELLSVLLPGHQPLVLLRLPLKLSLAAASLLLLHV